MMMSVSGLCAGTCVLAPEWAEWLCGVHRCSLNCAACSVNGSRPSAMIQASAEQSLNSEERQLLGDGSGVDPVRNGLSDDGRELESVARARADQPDLRMLRVTIYQKVAVGRVGVEAGTGIEKLTGRCGDVPRKEFSHGCHVCWGDRPADIVYGAPAAAVVLRDFYPVP